MSEMTIESERTRQAKSYMARRIGPSSSTRSTMMPGFLGEGPTTRSTRFSVCVMVEIAFAMSEKSVALRRS